MLELIGTVTTVMVTITFLVILVWAWSGRRKADFEEAANLVFDEPLASPTAQSPSTRRGEK